jgi:hypothetical protein
MSGDRIDQVHSVASRARHSFVGTAVIGSWGVDETLHIVPRGRAAIHKSIIRHAAHIQYGVQFTIPDVYLGRFLPSRASTAE